MPKLKKSIKSAEKIKYTLFMPEGYMKKYWENIVKDGIELENWFSWWQITSKIILQVQHSQ